MKTEWLALWKQREALYATKALTKKQIAALQSKVRIFVRHNKFYKADSNRPRFILCFSDESELTPIEFKMAQEEREFISVDTAIAIARSALRDLEYGYSIDDLIVEVEAFMRASVWDGEVDES